MALGDQLKAGLITPETTTYFCCPYALTQRPNVSTIRQAVSEPLVPTARKREITGILPDPIASPVRKLSTTVKPSRARSSSSHREHRGATDQEI
jgi:hypothetical protein